MPGENHASEIFTYPAPGHKAVNSNRHLQGPEGVSNPTMGTSRRQKTAIERKGKPGLSVSR